MSNLIIGIVFIFVGFALLDDPTSDSVLFIADEIQDFSSVQPFASYLMIFGGFMISLYSIKSIRNNFGKPDKICPECEETYEELRLLEACPKCGSKLELLDGFYDPDPNNPVKKDSIWF